MPPHVFHTFAVRINRKFGMRFEHQVACEPFAEFLLIDAGPDAGFGILRKLFFRQQFCFQEFDQFRPLGSNRVFRGDNPAARVIREEIIAPERQGQS